MLFPKYNLTYSQVNAQEYKRYVGSTVENTLFVILPFSALFSAFAVPVIHVLFESGNFNAVSTQMTSSVFAMYALGMAGFCVLDLINKAYYTMHKTLTPLLINAVVLALNIALNLVFRHSQSCGLIARTTAVSLTVGGVIALICFFRDTRGSLRTGKLLKNLAAAVLTGMAMWACESLLYRPGLSKLLTLLEFCALGLVGIGLYAGICWLLREREALQMIVQKFRKRA